MPKSRIETDRIFLAGLTILALWVLYLVLKPLLATMLLAALVAVLTAPLHRRLTARLQGRNGQAALLTCAGVTLVVLLPLAFILTVLTIQSIDLYGTVSDFLSNGGLRKVLENPSFVKAQTWIDRYLSTLGGQEINIKAKAAEAIQKLSGYFIAGGQKVAGNAVGLVGSFFLMLFTLYYLLVDGERMVTYLRQALPLPEERSRRLMDRFVDVTQASFIGTFGVAATQGILGGAALAMAGMQGVFWGLIMSFASLIPVVGTAMVWVPAAAYLLLSGRWLAAILLTAWCAVVVGSADNFLRPYLMGGKSGLHPLLILLSVFGGLQLFGVLGIFFGPLTAGLALTLVDMFREEFGHLPEEDAAPGEPPPAT
jgi:predicted PurR-regulated permease PerM